MCSRSLIKYFFFSCLFFIFYSCSSCLVSATYKYCDKLVYGTSFYDCGSMIYTYVDDLEHSSIVYSVESNQSILYAGKIEGIDIFFAKGIRFYNISYDDRSKANNNLWTNISSRGSMIYNGAFDDSWLIDDSHKGYYRFNLYNEVYTVRQYHRDGQLYNTIVIYNYNDSNIELLDIKYDDVSLIPLEVNEVLGASNGVDITWSSKYGLKNIEVSVNDVLVDVDFNNGALHVGRDALNANLIRGEAVSLCVVAYDYLGVKTEKQYKLILLNNNAAISFSTVTSIVESASRRIVINASAGKGKELDLDYCWYYWSTSPDDSLVYEEFLKNYANSYYKGSYSEDKGVILRNTSGTYYLYALAKDDDSFTVVRSEGYVLTGQRYMVSYSIGDAIFVTGVLALGVVSVLIYLYIRKKGY